MDPYDAIYFETYPGKKGLLRYLEVILQNVKVYHDYCVYGHLDYAVRYCPDKNYQFIYQDYADLIEEILKTIIEDGKGIEVNTGGYKVWSWISESPSGYSQTLFGTGGRDSDDRL